jgi:hypothetical protein
MSELEYARLAQDFQKQHRVILRELEKAVQRNAIAKRNRRWPCDTEVRWAIEAHRSLLRAMLEKGEELLRSDDPPD